MNFKKMIFSVFILLIIAIIYNYFQISVVYINKLNLNSNKISKKLKITQITDFHSNKNIDLDKLFSSITKFNPDIIVLTGDIIDFKTKDLDLALDLVKRALNITSRVYFVNGNHEIRSIFYKELTKEMEKLGAIFIENKNTVIEINDEIISISGVGFFAEREDYNKTFRNLNNNYYNILLSHSPNRPIKYLSGLEDLILTGHTHGGQIRIPFIGAIVAPGQGLFPKYDKGITMLGNTVLYIDSGLGNSVYPIRAFNRVQITNITIE